METLLTQAEEQSLYCYLRTLNTIYMATCGLEDDLKKFASTVVKEPAALSGFGVTLARCREDLFVPYLDAEKYIERESQCMNNTIQYVLKPFAEYQVARKQRAKNQGMFTKFSNAAVAGLSGSTSPVEQLQPLDGHLSAELVSRIISLHREASQRCKNLSTLSETYVSGTR